MTLGRTVEERLSALEEHRKIMDAVLDEKFEANDKHHEAIGKQVGRIDRKVWGILVLLIGGIFTLWMKFPSATDIANAAGVGG